MSIQGQAFRLKLQAEGLEAKSGMLGKIVTNKAPLGVF
jgi:hypothetical protein